jgi:nucleotide-binding universal stress UspA family protein
LTWLNVGSAAGQGADLIVTGGYGHSRLGERMFGGMMRGLLQHAPICLLMSRQIGCVRPVWRWLVVCTG